MYHMLNYLSLNSTVFFIEALASFFDTRTMAHILPTTTLRSETLHIGKASWIYFYNAFSLDPWIDTCESCK